jgi:hypothetical protein
VTFHKVASIQQQFAVCTNCLLVYPEINRMKNMVRTVLTYSTAWMTEYQLQPDGWRLSLIPHGAPVSPQGARGLESSSMSAK